MTLESSNIVYWAAATAALEQIAVNVSHYTELSLKFTISLFIVINNMLLLMELTDVQIAICYHTSAVGK